MEKFDFHDGLYYNVYCDEGQVLVCVFPTRTTELKLIIFGRIQCLKTIM